MVTRATRAPRAKKTTVADAVDATVKTETQAEADPNASFGQAPHYSWEAYFQSLREQFPPENWKRKLIAWTVSLAASFGVGLGIGWILLLVIIGAQVTGAGVFIQCCLYLIGLIMSMHYGNVVGTTVYDSIMNHTVDRMFTTAKAKVTGWFTPTPQGATA